MYVTNVTTQTNDTNCETVIKKGTELRNVRLEGVEVLRVDKCTITYEVLNVLNSKNKIVSTSRKIKEEVTPLTFYLTEVTPEELADYRMKEIPSFVFKTDGKYYHATIQDNINFLSCNSLGKNMCSASGHECKRLSAAADENGGCAKVRNLARRIEKYPWITKGYETFNTKHDAFVVIECSHYEKCPPRKKRPRAEVSTMKLNLAELYKDY